MEEDGRNAARTTALCGRFFGREELLGGQDGAEHRVRMKAVDASVLGARPIRRTSSAYESVQSLNSEPVTYVLRSFCFAPFGWGVGKGLLRGDGFATLFLLTSNLSARVVALWTDKTEGSLMLHTPLLVSNTTQKRKMVLGSELLVHRPFRALVWVVCLLGLWSGGCERVPSPSSHETTRQSIINGARICPIPRSALSCGAQEADIRPFAQVLC